MEQRDPMRASRNCVSRDCLPLLKIILSIIYQTPNVLLAKSACAPNRALGKLFKETRRSFPFRAKVMVHSLTFMYDLYSVPPVPL